MKVGIIAEGWDDCGVISNLIRRILPVESYDDIKYIRPKKDATDGDPAKNSNWPLVKQECIDKAELEKFLTLFPNEKKLLIVQIDTAECTDNGYDVERPQKSGDLKLYSRTLRARVVDKINMWLGNFDLPVCHAVAIEETEAWVIALLDNKLRKDTCSINDPKRHLENNVSRYIQPKALKEYVSFKSNKGAYAGAQFLSSHFTKKSDLVNARRWNCSLDLFCECLEGHANEN